MRMKWVYVIGAVTGGMIPAIYVYIRLWSSTNYTGADWDPILLSRGLALGFAVMPLGIGLGLFLTAMGQIIVNRLMLRIRRGDGRTNRQALGTSWVTQRHKDHAVEPGGVSEDDDS